MNPNPSRLLPLFRRLAAGLLLSGLAGTVAAQPATIGLVVKTEANPFFQKMQEGAQQAAQARGLRLLTGAGADNRDHAGQVAAVERMLAAGVKALLISPNDGRAIVPLLQRARAQGVLVIALDSPTDPPDAADALFATDNHRAGMLIGRYARAALGNRPPKVAMLGRAAGHTTGAQRHNGFMRGFGLAAPDARSLQLGGAPELVCVADVAGEPARGRAAMAECLAQQRELSVVYAINEPVALAAHEALLAAGRAAQVTVVTVDGGCEGVRRVKDGALAATAQQYPLRMATLGVRAAAAFIRDGTRPAAYVDTGVALIAQRDLPGVPSEDPEAGFDLCWGK
jgi:fructose transport system substrate-binding protein